MDEHCPKCSVIKPFAPAPLLGLWRRAFIVAAISAIPVMLLNDRWPLIIAVPIICGTVWIVWADLRGNGKRPNIRIS